MIIISHRGNLSGPQTASPNENSLVAAGIALDEGFHVELDLWGQDRKFYLGHDQQHLEPLSASNMHWLTCMKYKIWFHCKNRHAAELCNKLQWPQYFFHDQDECALTSNGIVWVYPGKPFEAGDIVVLPELWRTTEDLSACYGVCTDYPRELALL